MHYLITALKEAEIKLTDKIAEVIDQFISMLPKYIQNALKGPA